MYPQISRNLNDFQISKEQSHVSLDLEFNGPRPSILGLSAGLGACSVPWSRAALNTVDDILRRGYSLVGHNLIDADIPLIEKELGREIPLSQQDDTMLLHYLNHANFCSLPKAGKDEDDQDSRRGIGLLDLWSMSALYTDFPNWKRCRGDKCSGPCWKHDIFWYNGVDALSPDIVFPKLVEEMERKGIPGELYERVKSLTRLCYEMHKAGICVDITLARRLDAEFKKNKGRLFPNELSFISEKTGKKLKNPRTLWASPFNPNSPKQILDYFSKENVVLEDTSKESLGKALDYVESSDAAYWLDRLYQYKDEGKGLKAWFDDKYLSIKDGRYYISPRLHVTGTSTGRFSSSSPNIQNIPKAGKFGQSVRRCIIPRDEGLILAKADAKQGELRMCLWYASQLAGEPMPQIAHDAFQWLTDQDPELFEYIVTKGNLRGRKPREGAKSVGHAFNYFEGVKLYKPRDLQSSRIRGNISKGVIVLYPDWETSEGVVGFTGINLAQRLFGKATDANRIEALKIQEKYAGQFPSIRKWHKSLLEYAEKGFIQSGSGRYLELHGGFEERLKTAASFLGQGGLIDVIQESMLKYRAMGHKPLLNMHDELAFELPRIWQPKKIYDFMQVMAEPSKIFEGFSCPVDVKTGENFLDCKEVMI